VTHVTFAVSDGGNRTAVVAPRRRFTREIIGLIVATNVVA
jgi:hypothetical protein